ncbi:hypothetical protein Cyagr_1017 [Cyanobium gracile PCC 6307]|uniref:Uncharacterized protein n=1 Tax=Cyanobium gracile (strain ATCC 27147 / PCC 6307) TaxID=292564 RepID=K9P5C5_CYAGP|nr:hypothetical protein Cyagr_1017 [Cyanobium gracile PCC 6307]
MKILYTRQDVAISLPQSSHARNSSQTRVRAQSCRTYRLVDLQGEPHPILDDLYESLDAAWSEALNWWQEEFGPVQGPVGIGVEVSTLSGEWRTLRYPGT